MEIIVTARDETDRAKAVLYTQGLLAKAVRDKSQYCQEIAQRTLVETSNGVMTVGALVRSMRNEAAAGTRIQSMVDSLSARGLDHLAYGIFLVARADYLPVDCVALRCSQVL